MDLKIGGYLKEIEDAAWVQEVIAERFDGALELMTANSVVYGGAVRDCLSGKSLLGDLDIAVSSQDVDIIAQTFTSSPKWVQINEKHLLGNTYSNTNISGTLSFKTLEDKTVQLINSKLNDKNRLVCALHLAKTVDFVCCGVVMFSDGRVFEVVPGAYDDCKSGVLRLNKFGSINPDLLRGRIDKLTKREWKHSINVEKVLMVLRKRNKKTRIAPHGKQYVSLNPAAGKSDMESLTYIYSKDVTEIPHGASSTRIPLKSVRELYGGKERCIELIRQAARRKSINVRIQIAPVGSIHYETFNKQDSLHISVYLFHNRAKDPQKQEPREAKIKIRQPIVSSYDEVISSTYGTINSCREVELPDDEQPEGQPITENPIPNAAYKFKGLFSVMPDKVEFKAHHLKSSVARERYSKQDPYKGRYRGLHLEAFATEWEASTPKARQKRSDDEEQN